MEFNKSFADKILEQKTEHDFCAIDAKNDVLYSTVIESISTSKFLSRTGALVYGPDLLICDGNGRIDSSGFHTINPYLFMKLEESGFNYKRVIPSRFVDMVVEEKPVLILFKGICKTFDYKGVMWLMLDCKALHLREDQIKQIVWYQIVQGCSTNPTIYSEEGVIKQMMANKCAESSLRWNCVLRKLDVP